MSSKGVKVQGITINGDWLYITYTETNNVFKCRLATLTTTGTSPCEKSGADLLTNPMNLAFSNDGFAYITSAQRLITSAQRLIDQSVVRCTVDATAPRALSARSTSSLRALSSLLPPQAP